MGAHEMHLEDYWKKRYQFADLWVILKIALHVLSLVRFRRQSRREVEAPVRCHRCTAAIGPRGDPFIRVHARVVGQTLSPCESSARPPERARFVTPEVASSSLVGPFLNQ